MEIQSKSDTQFFKETRQFSDLKRKTPVIAFQSV